MENRFTVKDFFLFLLVIVVVVMVGLSMKQFDRQWQTVRTLEQQNQALTRDISNLRSFVQEVANRPPPNVTIQNVIPGGGAAAPTGQTPVISAIPSTQPVVKIDTTPAGNGSAESDTNPFAHLAAARALPDFAEGDWMIENFGTKLGRITCFIDEDVYGSTVRGRVMETLLTRDPATLKWKPLLAESFELSPDGLELRYKLRRGITFSDGTPFTADDVVFTFDWVMNPIVAAARMRSYLQEQGVSWEKVNDYEVVFRMKKPYFEFLGISGDTPIMSRSFVTQFSPSEYNENPGILLGTGPFRLRDPKGWRPGQRMELVRNERYWGLKPAFNRIIYLEVEEEAPEMTMFQNAEIDVLPCTPEIFDKLKADPKTMAKSKALEYNSMLGGYTYIGWNLDRQGKPTPFADKRVRQAMTMLVDRERMAQELWRGYAIPAPGPFSVNGRQAAPDVQPWPFDPSRAKSILADLGFVDRNGDGVLDTPDGKPFRFELIYSAKSEISQRIALFLKDSFARGGIIMDLKPTDWPTLLDLLNKRDFDAITLGWSASVESDLFQVFHSSQRKDGGDNRTGYSNPELDKLIEQARSTVDEDQRMKRWQAAARILAEDQPYTFLLQRKTLRFMDDRIKNVQPTRMGLNFMTTEVMPLPWYSPKGEQKYMDN